MNPSPSSSPSASLSSTSSSGGTPRRRVTSADVAREAGLSRATVSYVLNDTPHQSIPEPTRQRVLDAARRLGYAPSGTARALRTGRSDVVLCLLPDWPIGPSVGRMLESLSEAFAHAGLTFVVHPRGPSPRPPHAVWRAVSPAAVLGFDAFDDDETQAMHANGVEVVLPLYGRTDLSGPSARGEAGTLLVPETRVGRLQVSHLAGLGHHRIGYALPDDPRVSFFAQARLAGAIAECTERGLPEPALQIVPVDRAAGVRAVREWDAEVPAVTAVAAYNDDVALAVLAGLRATGRAVPDDVAVIGVDDIPAGAVSDPPLTTIRQPHAAVARHLAASVVARLRDQPVPRPSGADTLHVVRRATT